MQKCEAHEVQALRFSISRAHMRVLSPPFERKDRLITAKIARFTLIHLFASVFGAHMSRGHGVFSVAHGVACHVFCGSLIGLRETHRVRVGGQGQTSDS